MAEQPHFARGPSALLMVTITPLVVFSMDDSRCVYKPVEPATSTVADVPDMSVYLRNYKQCFRGRQVDLLYSHAEGRLFRDNVQRTILSKKLDLVPIVGILLDTRPGRPLHLCH